MEKEGVVPKYNGILLTHQKGDNAIFSNMDGPRDYSNKWYKSERERQIPHAITSVIESKLQHRSTYLPKKNRRTDIDNRLRVFQEGGG